MSQFLFELGTEELPPLQLRGLRDKLAEGMATALSEHSIEHGSVRAFASPRRLAVIVSDVAPAQPDVKVEKRGPDVARAFDDDGKPTKAALGFARSCGAEVADLDRLETDKGAWLMFRDVKQGQPTPELLPGLCADLADHLTTERMMRWGDSRAEFVRPVRWCVLLWDDTVLETNILGQNTGRHTRGHRFMNPGPHTLASCSDYESVTRAAFVIADYDERRAQIERDLKAAAGEEQVNIRAALLDEVTALTEWPVVLRGAFPPRFLALPPEVLITAMEKHQRYFALTNADGELSSGFLTVANIRSDDPALVIRGNERVIIPRLADAEFFFNNDIKRPLSDRVGQLDSLVFQNKLGSYGEKASRLSHIAGALAGLCGADEALAMRAARLAKADLVTDMVIEFPDLQGIMGGHYARSSGESDVVATAITEHYLPTGGGGALPDSAVSCCVALADKLDTLVGLFGIGAPPTGSRDPFALRRAAIGVIRIITGRRLPIALDEALEHARAAYDRDFNVAEVLTYFAERFRYLYLDQGFRADVVAAVLGATGSITNLVRADERIRALAVFRESEACQAVVSANKRVANILKSAPELPDVDTTLFESDAERALWSAVASARERTAGEVGDEQKLTILAGLQPPLANYFDDVMVMSDDPSLRANHMATLHSARALFLEVADLSELQTPGNG